MLEKKWQHVEQTLQFHVKTICFMSTYEPKVIISTHSKYG